MTKKRKTPAPDPLMLQTPEATAFDRMARYRKNPICPQCAAHPVVCIMRMPGYAVFRCRQCGHKWEVKRA
jgi:tRNA(Ile2) C34 agmatinyltransferase TiaS